MIGNINLEVSTAQAVTVSAVSTNAIDLQARADIGAERGLRMAVLMAAAVSPGLRRNVAVSFTDVGDLVGLVAHGLAAQTPVVGAGGFRADYRPLAAIVGGGAEQQRQFVPPEGGAVAYVRCRDEEGRGHTRGL